jgi:hypothetical protein
MRTKLVALGLTVVLILMIAAGTTVATGDDGVMARHLHMGGSNHTCADCHNGVRADPPGLLKGRYAHMGGPNKECADCHDGVKAPLLPLPPGYESCGDCHPSK